MMLGKVKYKFWFVDTARIEYRHAKLQRTKVKQLPFHNNNEQDNHYHKQKTTSNARNDNVIKIRGFDLCFAAICDWRFS